MVEIYESKGMSHEDAVACINIFKKYPDFFVDIMMQQELELQVPDEDHVQEAVREGFVMFCSFAIFGACPIMGYIVFPAFFPDMTEESLFVSACLVTAVVLFGMGCVKSFFSNQHWFTAGAETLLLGGTCATTAFVIGQWVEHLAN